MDNHVLPHIMKRVLCILLAVGGVLNLSGCQTDTYRMLAQTAEFVQSIGNDKPEDAPPGYFIAQKGKKALEAKNYDAASVNLCGAAKLGNKEVIESCILSSFLAAKKEPSYICYAETFDPEAKKLCSNYRNKEKEALQEGINKRLSEIEKEELLSQIDDSTKLQTEEF